MTPNELADLSMGNVAAFDREAWLSLFASDAVVQDPVGPAPWDPEGKGFRGKEAIGELYDQTVAQFSSLNFSVLSRFVGGNDAASLFKLEIIPKTGEPFEIEGIAIHSMDEDGKMAALRTYLTRGDSKFNNGFSR